MTLLHFIVKTVREKFPDIATFDTELKYVEKAATGTIGFFYRLITRNVSFNGINENCVCKYICCLCCFILFIKACPCYQQLLVLIIVFDRTCTYVLCLFIVLCKYRLSVGSVILEHGIMTYLSSVNSPLHIKFLS